MTQVKPFPLHQGPMPFSAHGTRGDHLSSQTRPNLGAGTTASGSRDGRLWAVLRLNVARRSLTSLGDFLAEIFEVTK